MKSVSDFIDHKRSDDIIFLGISPSTRTKKTKNGTFVRLKKWCDVIGLEAWDFHNVAPDTINSMSMKDVDVDLLLERVRGKKKVIALGGFVSRVCAKYDIPHHKADHPSSRNRNFNDPSYEPKMIERLKAYIYEH